MNVQSEYQNFETKSNSAQSFSQNVIKRKVSLLNLAAVPGQVLGFPV